MRLGIGNGIGWQSGLPAVGALSQVGSSGLLIYDDFNTGTADAAVGNGWVEKDVAGTLLLFASGGIDHPTADNLEGRISRQITGVPNDAICGFNIHIRISSGFARLFMFDVNDDNANSYRMDWGAGTDEHDILDIVGGSVESSSQAAAQIVIDTTFQGRLVREISGSDSLLRSYAFGGSPSNSVPDLEIQNGDLTLITSHTDVGGQHTGQFFGFTSHDQGKSFEYFLCGRNIVVTGIPSGHKIQLDSRAAVVESGGAVTIDVDTFELPAVSLKLLSPADALIDTITPDATLGRQAGNNAGGGIWGGDVYLVS